MDIKVVENILGRSQHEALITREYMKDLAGKKVLVTGAEGSLGKQCCITLREQGIDFLPIDITGNCEYVDIVDMSQMKACMEEYRPDVVLHFAGMKYATTGEELPQTAVDINIHGTENIIATLPEQAKLVFVSTCKACNPETAYGASKLAAERLVTHRGGVIARLYNVVQSQGNVFEIWTNTPENDPLLYVGVCKRFFISLDEAVGLVLFAATQKEGIYSVAVPGLREMTDIVHITYPDRKKENIAPRRGDRIEEKQFASHEYIEKTVCDESIVKIRSRFDDARIV